MEEKTSSLQLHEWSTIADTSQYSKNLDVFFVSTQKTIIISSFQIIFYVEQYILRFYCRNNWPIIIVICQIWFGSCALSRKVNQKLLLTFDTTCSFQIFSVRLLSVSVFVLFMRGIRNEVDIKMVCNHKTEDIKMREKRQFLRTHVRWVD